MYVLLFSYGVFNISFMRLGTFNKVQAINCTVCLKRNEGYILRWRVVRINGVTISSANGTGKIPRVWWEQPVQSDRDIFKDKTCVCHSQLQTCKAEWQFSASVCLLFLQNSINFQALRASLLQTTAGTAANLCALVVWQGADPFPWLLIKIFVGT